jgi:hypothetical protein
MSLDDRIRSAVDQAVGSLVDQLKQHASEDRDQAVAAAREQVFAEAEQATVARVADAEARVRATIEGIVATRCAEDRAVAARDIRKQLEEELSAKTADTLAAAEKRTNLLLADAESRSQEAVRSSVAAARVKERELELAAVNRLVESIRGLDGATSLSEVLDALALAAGKEAARAAVVVLRADRIQGWKLHGFGARDANPKAIDIPLAESGVIGMAVAAARPVTTMDSETAAIGPGFHTLPTDRTGLAVPVVVGGRVVAVIYADAVTLDGVEHLTPSGWPELIEVLARHAGRCLEAMTAQRAAPKTIGTPPAIKTVAPPQPEVARAEPDESRHSSPDRARAEPDESRRSSPDRARAEAEPRVAAVVPAEDESAAKRAARLLISEIRLYHEPAMHEGRQQKNLLERLGPEIERAKKLYDQQVPEDVRSKTDYFHQELVRTLAGGDASLLGSNA